MRTETRQALREFLPKIGQQADELNAACQKFRIPPSGVVYCGFGDGCDLPERLSDDISAIRDLAEKIEKDVREYFPDLDDGKDDGFDIPPGFEVSRNGVDFYPMSPLAIVKEETNDDGGTRIVGRQTFTLDPNIVAARCHWTGNGGAE